MRINVHCVHTYVCYAAILRTPYCYGVLIIIIVCMTKSVVEEAKLNNLK